MDSVTNAASELANGQIMDLTMSRNFDEFSIDNYFKMINLKTASLLSSCSEVGAILSGASDKEIRLMKNFGKFLGISFQIVDDLLDFTGESKSLGKKNFTRSQRRKSYFTTYNCCFLIVKIKLYEGRNNIKNKKI